MPIIDAIYTGGKFVPLDPVTLAENERVRLNVVPAPEEELCDDEFERRVNACKTYQELFEFCKTLPTDNGDYDMDRWIDESRRETGFRMPSEQPL